jgi:hypothetical protein
MSASSHPGIVAGMLAWRVVTARTIGLHTQTVAVATSHDRTRAVADFVCGSLESPEAAPSGEPIDTPKLADDATSAEALMRELARRLVWNYSDGLALHAAALELSGRVILFPATSGGGKSTLAVHLAADGWRFLTDELVFVPLRTSDVYPLCRPAHLKPGSVFLLERLPQSQGRDVQTYEHGALISPRVFGARATSSAPLPLGAIVFPGYSADAAGTALERLSKGVASYTLTAALVNARNLPQLGVAECARLATCTPAFRLSYRDLEDAEATLYRTLGATAASPSAP